MAITINTTPPEIVLAGNGVKYNVSTSTALSSAGTQAMFYFVLDSTDWEAITTGDTLTLAWDDVTLEFEFQLHPDESGLQLPSAGMFDNIIDYSTALRAALINNYYFAINCELLDTESENIFFHIRFATLGDFNLVVTDTPTGLTVTSTQGTDKTYNDNYKLCAAVFAPGLIGIEEKFPFPDLDVDFDLADYVRALAEGDFTMNPEALLIEHSDAIVPFTTKFFEKYGTPPVPTLLIADDTRYALPGGLDKTMINQFLTDETTWLEYFQTNKKFLTWADSGIKVKSTDIIRFYFLAKSTSTIYLKIAKYNVDGYIIGSWNTSVSGVSATDYKIIEAVLDPESIVTSTTHRIDFKLYAGGVDISETRSIYIDDTLSDQRLQFVFANSFEVAFDTIFAYGKAEHNIELDNYTLLSIDKNKTQSRSDRIEKLTIRSGHLTFRQLFYWQEFIQSNKRYLIRDGRRIPVRITSTNIFMYKNQEYNFGIELDLEIDDADAYRTTLPDTAITFSDYFNSYGYSIGLTAAIAGHVILDPDGNEMPQRNKLKFTGYGVNVSDSESGDMTIIDISSPGFWVDITAYFDLSVAAENQLLTTSDLTDSVAIDDVIRITQNSIEIEAQVTNITSTTITISTSTLQFEYPVTEVRIKSLDGPTASSKEFTLDSDDWTESSGVYTQTITVPHIRVISLVIVSPAGLDDANETAYATATIKGSTNGTNEITIQATTEPTDDINIQISYLWQ